MAPPGAPLLDARECTQVHEHVTRVPTGRYELRREMGGAGFEPAYALRPHLQCGSFSHSDIPPSYAEDDCRGALDTCESGIGSPLTTSNCMYLGPPSVRPLPPSIRVAGMYHCRPSATRTNR